MGQFNGEKKGDNIPVFGWCFGKNFATNEFMWVVVLLKIENDTR